jgi:hypothetical protein
LYALGIATQQLKELREDMTKADLKAEHAVAWLVLTHPATGPEPERLPIETRRVEERIALLMNPDALPRGIVFGQLEIFEGDEKRKHFWTKLIRTDPESRRIVEAARQKCEMEAALKNWN